MGCPDAGLRSASGVTYKVVKIVYGAFARARGRKGGARYRTTAAKVRLAMASMGPTETKVGALCRELGVTDALSARHTRRRAASGRTKTAGVEVTSQITEDRSISPYLTSLFQTF